MPFDTLGSRRGFRRARDPFGRVPPLPAPDPEITGFHTPFRIRRSVGMNGRNERRDVAKVENLLGGAGVLDLSETDGVTGFLGLRADDAIRRFQKDRGLRIDGLITPGGPTYRALVADVEKPARATTLPAPPPPIGQDRDSQITLISGTDAPTQSDVRRDNIARIARRMVEIRRAGVDPRKQRFASDGANSDDPIDPSDSGNEAPNGPKSPGQSPGTKGNDQPDADILGKMQEIIDALKEQTDPQAGDIDTAGPGEDDQNPPDDSKQGEQPEFEVDKRQEAAKRLLDNLLGLLMMLHPATRNIPPVLIDPDEIDTFPGGPPMDPA